MEKGTSFSWDVGIREEDFEILPSRLIFKSLVDIEAQATGDRIHEDRARSDAVVIKDSLLGSLVVDFYALFLEPLLYHLEHILLLPLLGSPLFDGFESPRSLLIHFRSGCDSIDRLCWF